MYVRVGRDCADLPIPELVENRRRSIAMLPPGAPALNRDEALELLEQLVPSSISNNDGNSPGQEDEP
jgi:hypothetical protein